MKHGDITVDSISNPSGTSAPSAGAGGFLGALALHSQIVAISSSLGTGVGSINNLPAVNSNFTLESGSGIEVLSISGGLVRIQLYTPISITSFTNSVNTVETGSTVSSVSFNWTLNKTETSQSLNFGIGSQTVGVRSYNHVSTFTTNRTYILTVGDGTSSTTASSSVSFSQKRWWGTSATGTPNSALILALANNEFSSTRVKSFSQDGNSQYIYYAYPASFGLATFYVNGLLSSAWDLTVVSHTNSSGYTENYNVYRSTYIMNGTGIAISVV